MLSSIYLSQNELFFTVMINNKMKNKTPDVLAHIIQHMINILLQAYATS